MREGVIVECVSADWSPLAKPRFSIANYPFTVGRLFTVRRVGRTPRECVSDLDGRRMPRNSFVVTLWELPSIRSTLGEDAYDPRRFRIADRSVDSMVDAVAIGAPAPEPQKERIMP